MSPNLEMRPVERLNEAKKVSEASRMAEFILGLAAKSSKLNPIS